ncbi:hypothetical protein DB30_02785 [Enhygromyxa salina]|uniref:Uncharacterized protein n=1 Tax=Enhygromyxa salina TaxID=215803 RepID=A0A0C2DDN7_9BACT|nr:hypothetical protein DB30_02785 [Enhygromyxa salina]
MAWQIGLATALVGGGALMVADAPLVMVGPMQFAALVFWIAIGSFIVSIEGRLPLETREDPPELLDRRYPTQRRRLAAMLVAYQLYQVTVLVLVLVSVKFWLDCVASYAVYHSWGSW